MSELSLKPIYQQISKQLIVIFVLIFLLLSFIFTVLSVDNAQQNNLNKTELKALQQKYLYQNQLLKTFRLSQDILTIQTAKNLVSTFDLHTKQWQQYIQISRENRLALSQWQVSNKKNAQIVARLTENSRRNLQLKRNSIIELELILQSIAMMQTDVSDNESIILSTLKDQVIVLFNSIEILNLQTTLIQFEQFSLTAKDIFAKQADINKLTNSKELIAQLDTLNSLLFIEQGMVAKWRGHLRLAKQYFDEVNNGLALLKQGEIPSLKDINQPRSPAYTKINFLGISLTQLQLNIMFVVVVVALFINIIILLFGVRTRIRQHSDSNVQLINALTDNSNISAITTESAESQLLQQQLATLQAPEFSAEDFHQIQADIEHQQQVLRTFNGCVFWQFENKYQKVEQNVVDLLLSTTKKQAKGKSAKLSWRQYFTKTHVKALLKVARTAKQTTEAKNIQVKTRSGLWVNIVICSKPNVLFGTIADSCNINKLTKTIIELEAELIAQNNHSFQEESIKSYKLNDMLIQAMLQSQRRSYVSNAVDGSLQDYRQLTRMLDWQRQHQIISHLKVSAKTLNLSDVHLLSEIQSASLNGLCEAHWQKNQLLLSCDQQLMTYAKLDARLFQRLLLVTIRLLLSEQFNAHCLLNIDVIDKNGGQQIIKFSGHVTLPTKTKNLPNLLKCLQPSEQEEYTVDPEMVRYFKSLLKSQHGSNLVIQKLENGFSLAFELPIAMVNHHKKSVQRIKLTQKNIIVVADNKTHETVIADYIKQADANIVCAGADYFTLQLTVEQLINKPVSAVIITCDVLDQNLLAIKQRISELPKRAQPKIMVLQAPFNAPLQQQGFYEQASYPLSKQSFLTGLQTLISGSKADNLLFEAEVFSQYQFETSYVEVLLAVPNPADHQSLLRLLHWCGLQIRIVSTGQAMKKHWQTGRYLILINAFSDSPFVELTTGKTIHRGVFNYSEQVISLTAEQKAISKSWQVANLSPLPSIAQLASLLSPWLKVKVAKIGQTGHVTQVASVNSNIKTTKNHHKTLSSESTVVAFDMLKYSKNQGSAELAAYMLEEYQQSNHRFLAELEMALSAQSLPAAKQALMNLEANAKILAAKEMIELCQSMHIALKKKDNNATNNLLNQITIQAELIDAFAESI